MIRIDELVFASLHMVYDDEFVLSDELFSLEC